MEDTEEIVAVTLNSTDDLFKLMVAMNQVRLEEIEAFREDAYLEGRHLKYCEKVDIDREFFRSDEP